MKKPHRFLIPVRFDIFYANFDYKSNLIPCAKGKLVV